MKYLSKIKLTVALILGLMFYFTSCDYAHQISQIANAFTGTRPPEVIITFEASEPTPIPLYMNHTVYLLQYRLNEINLTDAVVEQELPNRIIVRLPLDVLTEHDIELLVQQIGRRHLLTFQDEDGNVLLTGEDVAWARELAAAYVAGYQGSYGFGEWGTETVRSCPKFIAAVFLY